LRDFQTGAVFTTKISKVRFIVSLVNKEKTAAKQLEILFGKAFFAAQHEKKKKKTIPRENKDQ